uniref:Metalloendopeptidase n=1 Tax=Romanomermis culicivorax TaxID=13658 RepID=A0A915KPT2_ROMCU
MELTIGQRQKQMIRLALSYWRNTTCLEFDEREDQPQASRIIFTRMGWSCNSEVGKNYLMYTQFIYLPDFCFEMGTLVHEISHALGFFHEH